MQSSKYLLILVILATIVSIVADDISQTITNRALRGGGRGGGSSGGGRGGGGSSRGKSGSSNSNTRSSSGPRNDEEGELLVSLIAISLTATIIACIIVYQIRQCVHSISDTFMVLQNGNINQIPIDNNNTLGNVIEARSIGTPIDTIGKPESGKYVAQYQENGKTHVAYFNLIFTDIGRRYIINGKGHDLDGTTTIEMGHAEYDGNAYWVEKMDSPGCGRVDDKYSTNMKVLSTGQFNWDQNSFEGKFIADTSIEGEYQNFHLISSDC